jgi:hypothetical protein
MRSPPVKCKFPIRINIHPRRRKRKSSQVPHTRVALPSLKDMPFSTEWAVVFSLGQAKISYKAFKMEYIYIYIYILFRDKH